MRATLIVIQNDADHAEAKKLIERLLDSNDPADQARMAAQARLIEAYERSRWPRRTATVPEILTYLMDQHGLTRADLVSYFRRSPDPANTFARYCGVVPRFRDGVLQVLPADGRSQSPCDECRSARTLDRIDQCADEEQRACLAVHNSAVSLRKL